MPPGSDCREMLCERRRRPAAVLPGNNRDSAVRKRQARVRRLDTGIIPVPNRPGEDIDVHVARQLDLAVHARDVVGKRDHSGG
jgi:hypothetical protein